MAVATSILVGSAIAAGASAGAGIYAANKQAGAAENAAKTQSASAEKSAKIQTDSANYAADLQAKTAKEGLDFSRSNSQLSLDQYNQQQTRLQPYRNLGNFAMGLPNEAAPAPLRLPALPGQSGQPSTSAASGPPQSAPGASGAPPQGSDPASFTLSLVKGGMSPQQAAQQTNQKFGLQTGAEAVYYPDTNTIGLPNVYLAGPTGRPDSPAEWNITPRVGGGGSGSASRAPVTLGYRPTPTPFKPAAPLTPALQAPEVRYRPLGSIGAY